MNVAYVPQPVFPSPTHHHLPLIRRLLMHRPSRRRRRRRRDVGAKIHHHSQRRRFRMHPAIEDRIDPIDALTCMYSSLPTNPTPSPRPEIGSSESGDDDACVRARVTPVVVVGRRRPWGCVRTRPHPRVVDSLYVYTVQSQSQSPASCSVSRSRDETRRSFLQQSSFIHQFITRVLFLCAQYPGTSRRSRRSSFGSQSDSRTNGHGFIDEWFWVEHTRRPTER
jgi:hypothetical protein